MSFRLAVLSDLHIDRDADADSWALANTAFAAAAAKRPDHIVVAGDLFDSASAMRRDRVAVRRLLKRLGLWRPERLSLVIGGHDIFEIGHRGNLVERALTLARAARAGAQRAYDEFCAWAGEIVPRGDRHRPDALYPYRRHLDALTVVAADSTPAITLQAAEGRWRKDEDRAVRALLRDAQGHRLLAVHNQPEESDSPGLLERLQGYVGGYPAPDLRRIARLVDDARIETVVCGHVHVGGDRSWPLGRRTEVLRAGETGGVHGATPSFLMLEVPRRGAVRWRRIRF